MLKSVVFEDLQRPNSLATHLDKLRAKLSISEECAREIEQSLSQPQLTEEEQEYLDEYREMASEGEITPRERKLLEKIAAMSGISSERAAELENMAK